MRFLQMMLRTFDELGYAVMRKVPLLGLLKLVHLRRLLPVEELLSQFPAGRTSGAAAGSSGTGSRAVTPAVASSVTAPVVTAKPAFSPFEQSKKRFDEPPAQAGNMTARWGMTIAAAATPSPVIPPMVPVGELKPVAPVAEMVKPAAVGSQDAGALQKAVVEALQGAGKQSTAADAFDDAEWTVEAGELRVQMLVSKAMLPSRVELEAEKIVARSRESGAGSFGWCCCRARGAAVAAPK